MESFSAPWFIALHGSVGNGAFIAFSALLSALLCFWAIPVTTDLMVNNGAGLAARRFGNKSRTLFINASTNNPEAANMLISFVLLKLGGWANPLGSLVANLYLMFLFAPLLTMGLFVVRGQSSRVRDLFQLLLKEKRLVAFHVVLCVICAGFGLAALELMEIQEVRDGEMHVLATPQSGAIAYGVFGLHVLVVGILVFGIRRLQRRRPELVEDIDSSEHGESWGKLIGGTCGLILAAWIMNSLFLAWTELYTESLTDLLGDLIFTMLHFVLGALITSLPEMTVAVKNYRRLTSPDLNTALGSATYSNVVNVTLCLLGLLVFLALSKFGILMQW